MGGYLILAMSMKVEAMHIAEGFLPVIWAGLWWLLFLPFLYFGIRRLKKMVAEEIYPLVQPYLGAFQW